MQRAMRLFGFAVVLLVLLSSAAAFWSACSPARENDRIGQTKSAVVAPYDGGPAQAVFQPSSETSGTWVDTNTQITAFNTGNNPNVPGWAISTDNTTTVSYRCDFAGTGTAGCLPVPGPPGFGAPAPGFPDGGLADGGQGWAWVGDPTLITDGRRNLVYVSMIKTDPTSTGSQVVAASLSTDNGKTFVSSSVVNSAGECMTGRIDQPDAVFDYTTEPPTLWVIEI